MNSISIKTYLLIVIVSLSQFPFARAQNFILLGDKAFGGNKVDIATNFFHNDSNQFFLIGSSQSDVSGDKTEPLCDTGINGSDIWVIKIDTAFNIMWDGCIGGNKAEVVPWLLETSDKGMIFCGISKSDSSCEKSENSILSTNDYWVCSVDSNGSKIWDRTYGGNNTEVAPQIIRLSTGYFIICGSSSSPISGDKTVSNFGGPDFWAVKIDSLGNKIWDNVYGGSGIETTYGDGRNFSLLSCGDGNFIILGSTQGPASGSISQPGQGSYDIWLIKVDSGGNKIWDRRFGGTGDDFGNHIIQTSDSGYIICGVTYSFQSGDVSDPPIGGGDFWVLKLNSLGNKQWDKRYGGNHLDIGTYIKQTVEGGYWIAGNTTSDSSFDVIESPYGSQDCWIIKIDSAGNKIYNKRFGGPGNNSCRSFVQMPDSSIYLYATADSGTSSIKTDAGKGASDYWLVHFKYTCATTTSINEVACYSYTSPSGNYNWNTSGIYIDTLTNATGCDSVITINLAINTVDTTITANVPYLSSNATGAIYQWMYCDSSLIAGATNQSYTATTNGSYAVIVSQNNCADTSSCYLVLNVGIDEKGNESTWEIYPNPVKNVLIISCKKQLQPNDVITISDMQGRVIKEEKILENNNKNIPIDVTTLSQDVYLLKVNETVKMFVKI